MKNHIIPKIGGITVSKLNRGHIVELYRVVSQHSLESAKLSRVIIRTALRYAEQNNYISSFIAEILPEEVLFERPIINAYTDEQSFLSNTLIRRMLGEKLYGFLLAK